MQRLKVTGPHRESGSYSDGSLEFGYGDYWHAVDNEGMIWSWGMTKKGNDPSSGLRRRILARGRYEMRKAYQS